MVVVAVAVAAAAAVVVVDHRRGGVGRVGTYRHELAVDPLPLIIVPFGTEADAALAIVRPFVAAHPCAGARGSGSDGPHSDQPRNLASPAGARTK